MRICVAGAGSWGTALAQVLAATDADVVLWARRKDVAEALVATRRNPQYLSEIELDASVDVTADLAAAVRGAAIILLAVPTHAMRDVAVATAASIARDSVVVSAAKGFEEQTSLPMSDVLCAVLGDAWDARIVALSGPNIAIEVARGLPAATVVAGAGESAGRVRDACSSATLRVYSSDDRTGVEYAGALKNVLAIAVGACEGMGVGDNGKAAIMTRGIAEITRLGVSYGAQPLTFAGLAGLGDCVVTCMSPHSRNRQLGEAIGRGAGLEAAMAQVRMVVEGVNASKVAARLAERHHVDMPITREVNAVLFEHKPVGSALADLMRRDPAQEVRGLASDDPLDSQRRLGE